MLTALTALTAALLVAAAAPAAAAVSVVDVIGPSGLAATVNDADANTCHADLNGDGRMDLVLSQHLLGPTQVFLARGDGTYRLVQELKNRDPHGCALYTDGLGRRHLLFAMGAEHGTATDKSNADWLLDGRGNARLQPGFLGTRDPSGRGRVLTPVRIDRRPGLFVGNHVPGPGGPSVNHLYASAGGQLVEVQGPFTRTTDATCAETTDTDRDGTDELLVCTGTDVHLWERVAGRWVDRAPEYGIGEARRATFADVDSDGDLDLVTAGETSLVVYLRTATGALRRAWSRPILAGRSVAVADVDADGHADLYVVRGSVTYDSNRNAPDLLLLGDGTGRSWKDRSDVLPQVITGGGNDVTVLRHAGHVRLLITNGGDNTVRRTGGRFSHSTGRHAAGPSSTQRHQMYDPASPCHR